MKPSSVAGTAMRIASFLFGCGLILASIPVAMMGGPGDEDAILPLPRMPYVLLIAALLASGFLYAGFRGDHVRRSARHRLIAAVLLLPSLGAGVNLLLIPPVHPELRTQGLVLFLPACALLLWSTRPWRRMSEQR